MPTAHSPKTQFDLLALFDLSNRLTGTLDHRQALRTILYTAMAHAGSLQAGLYVTNSLRTTLEAVALQGSAVPPTSIPLPDPWINRLAAAEASLPVSSTSSSSPAERHLSHLGFAIAWPIRRDRDLTGLLALGPCRTASAYATTTDHLIGILAAFAATLIERQRLLSDLQHSETLSALGQLVAGIAHELKNPLSAILGYAQLIAKGNPDAKILQDADAIHRQAQRALDTIQQLLTFARQRPIQPRPMDLREVVQEAVRLHSPTLSEGSITVDVHVPPSLPPLSADPAALQHALLNLLHNAADAIRARPSSFRDPGRITVSVTPTAHEMLISVHDNGCGVPAAIQSRIFDPFFTTKPVGSGTGLGLSLVHSLVAQHGGSLTVESREGAGATFVIHLPLHATS